MKDAYYELKTACVGIELEATVFQSTTAQMKMEKYKGKEGTDNGLFCLFFQEDEAPAAAATEFLDSDPILFFRRTD